MVVQRPAPIAPPLALLFVPHFPAYTEEAWGLKHGLRKLSTDLQPVGRGWEESAHAVNCHHGELDAARPEPPQIAPDNTDILVNDPAIDTRVSAAHRQG
jgi:hypothetical protein